jgi:hypothetical protein
MRDFSLYTWVWHSYKLALLYTVNRMPTYGSNLPSLGDQNHVITLHELDKPCAHDHTQIHINLPNTNCRYQLMVKYETDKG